MLLCSDMVLPLRRPSASGLDVSTFLRIGAITLFQGGEEAYMSLIYPTYMVLVPTPPAKVATLYLIEDQDLTSYSGFVTTGIICDSDRVYIRFIEGSCSRGYIRIIWGLCRDCSRGPKVHGDNDLCHSCGQGLSNLNAMLQALG